MVRYGLFLAGTLLADLAPGAALTLSWDDAGPHVAGYRLHYGLESLDYPFVIDVGLTTSSPPPPNLVFGTTYFFAVTAYSHVGTESDFSAEIIYTPRLEIGSIFTDDYGTVLSWASEPGALYRVLATDSLAGVVAWVDVSGPLFATSNTRVWLHVKTPADRSRFYRIETISGFR